jgi:release factor glutamine methyltransferase
MKRTVKQILFEATNKLRSITDTPSLDASVIFTKVTNLSKVQQITQDSLLIDKETENKFNELINRRLNYEPVAYIIEEKEFYGRPFKVTKDTLIPRADTETLIEEVIKYSKTLDYNPEILDLCTGSGCIGITLANEITPKSITLSDISKEALEVAKINAKKLSKAKINIIESNLLEKCKKYDIIVSNPPYLTKQWCEEVSNEVKKEPILALEGFGNDGLDIIRAIVYDAKNHLNGYHSAIFFECDSRQCSKVKELLEANSFKNVSIIKDLANKDRVVKGIYER